MPGLGAWVLVVDDQPANRSVMVAMLAGLDTEIETAASGAEALEVVEAREPVLVLLDMRMPGMDGLETARRLRALPNRSHVPILFVTAQDDDLSAVLEGYESGAVDYLFKPVEPVIVRAKVKTFLELHTQRRVLEERTHELAEASRFKSQFLANMSHELRTPLNAIIGFSQLLHDEKVGPMSADQREFLGDILTSSRHLLLLINDVLDLSRVEHGQISLRPERFELKEIVAEVLSALGAGSLLRAEGVAIDVEISPEAAHLYLDPDRLKQVLYNYLSNAIKFNREGGRIQLRAQASAGGELSIEVEDEGLGIRESDVGLLFTEFQQIDSGAAKRHQGTGLGLALTKRLVEVQGGSVGVRSVYGQGSTFWAEFPASALRAADKEVAG